VGVGSMPPNLVGLIHHEMYELLIQSQSIPDGHTAALIEKHTEYPESLGCFCLIIPDCHSVDQIDRYDLCSC
jgi:hypothetical protein